MQHRSGRSGISPVLLALVAVAASDPAQAQSVMIEEVTVTAQRKAQNLQEVPVAVSALSREQLDYLQLDSALDLVRTVPNMIGANTVGLGTSATYFLRGVGSTESIATFDVPVGTYIDEVYISRQNANQIALSSVERIEVLRGPQGTLFGRNTTGGAIQIITEKPDTEFGGQVEAGYGRYDRVLLRGEVNVPVSDTILTRFSAFSIEDDGWLDSTLSSDSYNSEESWGVRAAVRFLPAESVVWDVSGQYLDSDYLQIGTPQILNPDTLQGTGQLATGDLLKVRLTDGNCESSGDITTWANQGCQFNQAKSELFISNLSVELGAGSLSLISGYYSVEQRYNIDFLGNTNQPVFGGLFGANFYISNDADIEQWSHELKWSADALEGRLRYVAGLFYMDETNKTRFIDTINLPVGPGFNLPTVLANRDVLGNTTTNSAIYAQADYDLSSRFTLQLGLRYTDEEKEIRLNGTSLDFATFSQVPLDSAALVAAGIPLKQSEEKLTPRIALNYQVDESIMLYASYTEGFKSGGWNARGTQALELQPFGPEFVDSYELGVRAEILDGRARLNGTLFRAEYSDLQVPSVFPQASTFVTLNSGDATVDGVELESLFRITAGLDVFLNVGLMDAGYDTLTPGAVAAGIGPKMQRAPDATAQIGFNAHFPLGEYGSVMLTADAKYTDEFEMDPSNNPTATIDAVTLYNAQVRWTDANDRLSVIAECSNCSDKRWFTQNLFDLIYAAEPRRWNVRVQYRF